jgi:hypothetical protein
MANKKLSEYAANGTYPVSLDLIPMLFWTGSVYTNKTFTGLDLKNKIKAELETQNSFYVGNTTLSANTTLTEQDMIDNYSFRVDATGGARTITLPPYGSVGQFIVNIRKVDSSGNAVTIEADGSETINGALTYVLATQYKSVILQSVNSVGWEVISAF